MKKAVSYVPGFSLGCNVVLQAKVQTRFKFDADKLGAEIEHRNRSTAKSKAAVVHIEETDGPNCYVLTFAHPDALDDIYETIEEIEKDVERAWTIQSLLDLVVD